MYRRRAPTIFVRTLIKSKHIRHLPTAYADNFLRTLIKFKTHAVRTDGVRRQLSTYFNQSQNTSTRTDGVRQQFSTCFNQVKTHATRIIPTVKMSPLPAIWRNTTPCQPRHQISHSLKPFRPSGTHFHDKWIKKTRTQTTYIKRTQKGPYHFTSIVHRQFKENTERKSMVARLVIVSAQVQAIPGT